MRTNPNQDQLDEVSEQIKGRTKFAYWAYLNGLTLSHQERQTLLLFENYFRELGFAQGYSCGQSDMQRDIRDVLGIEQSD